MKNWMAYHYKCKWCGKVFRILVDYQNISKPVSNFMIDQFENGKEIKHYCGDDANGDPRLGMAELIGGRYAYKNEIKNAADIND